MGIGETPHRRVLASVGAIVVVCTAVVVVLVVHGRADSAAAPVPPKPLPASAVAYLPSRTAVVTSSVLSKDATLSQLPSTLSRLGFVVGGQRTFQGPSRHRLTLVISRTLRFENAAGAAGFVKFVGQHAGDYVGEIPGVKALVSHGRRGVLITAPLCACHMAQPLLLGLVASGWRVTWLEINGPAAKPGALRALIDTAP